MKAVNKNYIPTKYYCITRLPLCMAFSLLLFKKKIQIPFLSFLFSRWNQIDLFFLI